MNAFWGNMAKKKVRIYCETMVYNFIKKMRKRIFKNLKYFLFFYLYCFTYYLFRDKVRLKELIVLTGIENHEIGF